MIDENLKEVIFNVFKNPCPNNLTLFSNYYDDDIKCVIEYHVNDIHIDVDDWYERLHGEKGLWDGCDFNCYQLDILCWLLELYNNAKYKE